MKKKSVSFVDNVCGRLMKNSFLSIYRTFQIDARKKIQVKIQVKILDKSIQIS